MSLFLQRLLPPTRRWAWIEGGAIVAATLAVIFRIFMPVPAAATSLPVAAAAATAAIADPDREKLTKRFASGAATSEELSRIVTQMIQRIEDLQLVLESRNLEAPPAEQFPRRERHRILVSGTPSAHAQFLHYLTATPLPLRLQEFNWTAGRGSSERMLEVVLDFLIE